MFCDVLNNTAIQTEKPCIEKLADDNLHCGLAGACWYSQMQISLDSTSASHALLSLMWCVYYEAIVRFGTVYSCMVLLVIVLFLFSRCTR